MLVKDWAISPLLTSAIRIIGVNLFMERNLLDKQRSASGLVGGGPDPPVNTIYYQ
jgi:hypothetical protein